MTEQKNERRMLEEISKQVSPEVAKAILQAGYQSLLGGDLAKNGLHPYDAEKIRNLRQCFGEVERGWKTSELDHLEEKLVNDAFAKLVEGKQVHSIVHLQESTGRHAYQVPEEIIREEFLYVLKDIRETSSEFPLTAEGSDWMGNPKEDPLMAEIRYLGKLRGFYGAISPEFMRDVNDARREIRETQDALVDRIFRVEIYSGLQWDGAYRDCTKWGKHGIEYALDIAEELDLKRLGLEPVSPETMQKAFVQYLDKEGMGAVRKLAERVGVKPSRQIFDKYLENL